MAQPTLNEAAWSVEIKTKKAPKQPAKYSWLAKSDNLPVTLTGPAFDTERAAKAAFTRFSKKNGLTLK